MFKVTGPNEVGSQNALSPLDEVDKETALEIIKQVNLDLSIRKPGLLRYAVEIDLPHGMAAHLSNKKIKICVSKAYVDAGWMYAAFSPTAEEDSTTQTLELSMTKKLL